MTMRRIVVVGNGIAGLTACDTLRSAGFDGELTIVGAERHHPYSRPALSKAVLHDHADPTGHVLPAPTHGADELLGVGAAGLDVERRLVHLDGGDSIPYDGLVIASGSRARRFGDGAANAGRAVQLTLRTVEDALELRRRIRSTPAVVVVGGGALGMEVASGCLAAGCEVTMVSDGPPLTRQVGSHLSAIFVAAAREAGLRIRTAGKARVAEVDGAARVVLDDGTIDAELVVAAVGDRPNTEWLEGSGLLVDGALRVDSRGRVRRDIVAAGDVTSFPTRQGLRRVPLWTSAIDQARSAAAGLLRGDDAAELDFEPYFWTEAFDLSLKSVGDLPRAARPDFERLDPDGRGRLMSWNGHGAPGAAAAIDVRIPVPKLRRLARIGPSALQPSSPMPA